jgi:hypothetical protein
MDLTPAHEQLHSDIFLVVLGIQLWKFRLTCRQDPSRFKRPHEPFLVRLALWHQDLSQ